MTTARKISAKEAREEFSEIINQAAFGSKRTIITRHGKEVAAVISISDLERLTTSTGGFTPRKSGKRSRQQK